MKQNLIIVQTSVSEISVANTIAAMLIESHLAACVKIIPGVTSFYMWHDRLNSESEYIMQFKTIADKFEAVKAAILKVHPYDVPEIISTPVDQIHNEYYDWVIKATSTDVVE